MQVSRSSTNLYKQGAEVSNLKQIMIIDLDRDLVHSLRYAMEFSGYEITQCRTCFEALTHSMSQPVQYFIIHDRVPGMDSITLVKRLRTQFPTAVIIGMSDSDRGVEYLRSGANDFLQKPFAPYRLFMMIDGGDIAP